MSRRCKKKNHLFLNWLKANRSRFAFTPGVVRYHKNRIDLCLTGITPAVHLWFNPNSGIEAAAFWEGELCDFLVDLEIAVVKSEVGYYCEFCYEHLREYYPTLKDLWTTHCFERFLDWVNTDLVDAQWLEIKMDCGTSARLHKEKPPVSIKAEDHKQYIIELHVK